MTTATFSSFRVNTYRSGAVLQGRARDAVWFAPSSAPLLDAGDFCAVAFAFAFAAGLVLGGAVVCDAYLAAVISRGAGSLDDFAGYQLARDLLPWAGTFTAIAAGLALLGLKLAHGFRARSAASGFSTGATVR